MSSSPKRNTCKTKGKKKKKNAPENTAQQGTGVELKYPKGPKWIDPTKRETTYSLHFSPSRSTPTSIEEGNASAPIPTAVICYGSGSGSGSTN